MARTFSTGNLMSNASAVFTVAPITMVCWFKVASFAGTQTLISLDNNATSNRISVDCQITTGVVRANISAAGSNTTAFSTAGASTGVWQHAAAVFASATDRRAFLNGGNKGTDATSKTPTGIISTRLGSTGAGGGVLAGDAGEAAIWDVALSDADVALLATGISPYEVQRANLRAYWPLIGAASPEPDVVGSFPMTLAGTPPQVAHPFMFYGKNRFQRRGMLVS